MVDRLTQFERDLLWATEGLPNTIKVEYWYRNGLTGQERRGGQATISDIRAYLKNKTKPKSYYTKGDTTFHLIRVGPLPMAPPPEDM